MKIIISYDDLLMIFVTEKDPTAVVINVRLQETKKCKDN